MNKQWMSLALVAVMAVGLSGCMPEREPRRGGGGGPIGGHDATGGPLAPDEGSGRRRGH